MAPLLLLCTAAQGAPTHPCSEVVDEKARLACYDEAFGAPATPADSATRNGDFGLPADPPSRDAAAARKQESVSAAITALDRLRDGKFVVTLDNGQIWQQSENNSGVDLRVGDTVKVRRGALGSYLLVSKAGVGTRVKRVR